MTLCKVCTDILYHKKNCKYNSTQNPLSGSLIQIIFNQHATTLSLESSATQGCIICRDFWQSCNKEEQEGLQLINGGGYVSRISVTCEHPQRGLFELRVSLDDSVYSDRVWVEIPKRSTGVRSHFILQPNSDLPNFAFGHPTSDSTGSDESWETARCWLETCQMQHPKCSATTQDRQWYPTRLLDLRTCGQVPPTLKLIETVETEMKDSQYITLSYCWGKLPVRTLTRESYSAFRQGILIDTLPKTFQHAIIVAQRLEIRFLWIDSLCIIQNDAGLADWIREAALMHRVYAYAMCSIAATGSSDSSQGLFYERDAQSLQVQELDLCLDPFKFSQEHLPSTKWLITNKNFWLRELDEAPLHHRGWVVQERLLARRVIHFGQNQLFWECREIEACETYPVQLPPFMNTNFKAPCPDSDGKRLNTLPLNNKTETALSTYELWRRVIAIYTKTNLTKPQDKLIAVSGLAKRYSSILEDDYVVGLWRRNLASQLLWYVMATSQGKNEPSVRPAKYRCPSFSWASVDARILPGLIGSTGLLITVQDVCIDYTTEDKTGLVKGGYLVVQGALKPLRLAPTVRAGYKRWKMIVNGHDAGPGTVVYLDVDQQDFEPENGAGTLYFLPARDEKLSVNIPRLKGLMLESCGLGVYRRLGVAHIAEQEIINMVKEPPENAADLPCKSFDPIFGLHTIHLI